MYFIARDVHFPARSILNHGQACRHAPPVPERNRLSVCRRTAGLAAAAGSHCDDRSSGGQPGAGASPRRIAVRSDPCMSSWLRWERPASCRGSVLLMKFLEKFTRADVQNRFASCWQMSQRLDTQKLNAMKSTVSLSVP